MEPLYEWVFSTQVLKKEGAGGDKRELTMTWLTRPLPQERSRWQPLWAPSGCLAPRLSSPPSPALPGSADHCTVTWSTLLSRTPACPSGEHT